jgi:hypothetical protein
MRSLSNPAHRRAESAPELVPFENKVSSTLMEDVFEEEDEDADEEQKFESDRSEAPSTEAVMSSDTAHDEIRGMGIHVVEGDGASGAKKISWPPENLLPWSGPARPASPSLSSKHANGTAGSPPAERRARPRSPFSEPVREASPVEVVEAEEEPRAESLTRDSDSTITPSVTPDGGKEPLMTLSLPMPQHSIMTPDSLSSSSFSGRDFTISSQTSIDTPRLGTATSFGTESRSVCFGEPGPEVRMSYEDVPSLTSSRSTMTSPAQHHPFARPGSSLTPEESQPFSLPFAADGTRKRSSIASLSRLVGLSSGERSKLSIESRPQSQHSNSASALERKKPKRLSKLVSFFTRKQGETDHERPSTSSATLVRSS